jgi:DNA (cytosine-5)-methyltransferase 1
MIPVIDIFAGPGGLGEGFTAPGVDGCPSPFKIALSIEKHKSAHLTLQFRSFFRQFPPGKIPSEYYSVLRGEVDIQKLFDKFPKEAGLATTEAWLAELGVVSREEVSTRISKALTGNNCWVLIGGPPCQPYSVAGRSRVKGMEEYTPEKDHRHRLYREYLHILARHWPPVFVMENVTGLLSSQLNGESMFDHILRDLHSPAKTLGSNALDGTSPSNRYRIASLSHANVSGEIQPQEFIVKAEELGVPQARHRVILVGIREDLGEIRPELLQIMKPVPAREVLSGLPRLRSGLSRESDNGPSWKAALEDAMDRRWLAGVQKAAGEDVHEQIVTTLKSLRQPRHGRGNEFIRCAATCAYESAWFVDKRIEGACNHASRAHIRKDLHRYLFVSCFARVHKRSPRLKDFPPDLLPEHENVKKALKDGGLFNDRFRVQMAGKPSTTITSHIAKDGHYYIHPDPAQCRSLTVREAARLQTFPDNYFFTGNRTSQYKQVGNAVPPLMARAISERVYEVLRKAGLADGI